MYRPTGRFTCRKCVTPIKNVIVCSLVYPPYVFFLIPRVFRAVYHLVYKCLGYQQPHRINGSMFHEERFQIAVQFQRRMMTSWNENISHVTGPLCGEFGGHRWSSQRPVTRNFDVIVDLRQNKRLSKQSGCWWFGTPWRSWWSHCNGEVMGKLNAGYHITCCEKSAC